MYSKIFGERLSELLDNHNLKELAKNLDIALSSIYGWKNGEREINLLNLVMLANYFEISIENLIGRSDDDNKFICKQSSQYFGVRLREVMKEKNISTYYLRKNYKYGSKHFANWSNGAHPLLSTLIELSDILDCTIDYLVGRFPSSLSVDNIHPNS